MRMMSLLMILTGILCSPGKADARYSFEHAGLGMSRTFIQSEKTGVWDQIPRDREVLFQHASMQSPAVVAVERNPFVTLGLGLWELIKNNDTPVDAKDHIISVLPAGVSSPMELGGWVSGHSHPIRTVFDDRLGFAVVDFRYHLVFEFDAKHQGRGSYLSNVAIVIDELDVASLYRFDVKVTALAPYNIGPVTSPIPQLKLLVQMSVADTFLGGRKTITDEIRVNGRGVVDVVQKANAR